MKKLILMLVLLTGLLTPLRSQEFKMNPRLSYYTSSQSQADLLMTVPAEMIGKSVRVTAYQDKTKIFVADTTVQGRLLRVPISIAAMGNGTFPLRATLSAGSENLEATSILMKLEPKANGVQIDRLTGKLIMNGLPWFPFGFYCYSPVDPELAEHEVVKGFNLMSPYQTIDPATIGGRQVYMDRCARLGMKVHYQLISVAGGGGVGSARLAGLGAEEKMKRLQAEIEHFRNHPALLAWYLSDEPTGQGVPADSLQKIYDFIKELDPYHPITIVFDAPQRAREYASAMDIVMADPYPIPGAGVEGVGAVTEGLMKAFRCEKPVWIVPQAFGGGEWWGREPSPQEVRAMTYLALVRGATGIQYFIRHGANGFPKSTVTWDECSRAAIETGLISPYLLNGSPVEELLTERDGVWTNGWLLGEERLVMVVNSNNRPVEFTLAISGTESGGMAEVMFENRQVKVADGLLSEPIGPLGVRIYRLGAVVPKAEEGNMLSDPGFESLLSYGVPAACYARVGSDPGSSAFLDPRTRVEGHTSLRLTTSQLDSGMGLSFFPVSLNSGQSYRFSIWSRALESSHMPAMKTGFFNRLFRRPQFDNREFRLEIAGLVRKSFRPDEEWKPYTVYFRVPEDGSGQVKVNPYLELTGQGTAWFDRMNLTSDPVLGYRINTRNRKPEIIISTVEENAEVRYNLEGRIPKVTDPEYRDPLVLKTTTTVAAGVFGEQGLLGWTMQSYRIHLAVGRSPAYEKKYYPKYSAGGDLGLVDGLSGSRNYLDGRWQGINGQDLRVIIDLDSVTKVNRVSLGCLQDISAWIFMPLRLEVEGSTDGRTFASLGVFENQTDERARGAIRKDFTVECGGAGVRYLRVRAVSRKICPAWHNGNGKPAFIFLDEITVE